MNETECISVGSHPQMRPNSEGVDLDAVRCDYTVLDTRDVAPPRGGRIITYEDFSPTQHLPDYVEQVTINPGRGPGPMCFLRSVVAAHRLLRRTGKEDVLLVNGGATTGKLVGLLNRRLPLRKRRVVMFALYCGPSSPLKSRLSYEMVQGCCIVVVWSRRQLATYSEHFHLADERFVFMPYKANHSKHPPIAMPLGNYVFAGGNSRRDYKTLFAAVEGTGVPVIISATDPRVTERLQVPQNVIHVAAHEPAFARLMAGSRFTVLPLEGNLVRGAGEATVCNSMWHGKPVIVADDVSACEYVEEGVTGYVVPPGDPAALRRRIVELWQAPEKAAEMGRHAHERVAARWTHDHFVHRLIRLAALAATSDTST